MLCEHVALQILVFSFFRFIILSCHYVTVFVCRVLTYDLEQRVLGGYPCHGSVTIAVFREILKTVHQANMFKALFAAFARRS